MKKLHTLAIAAAALAAPAAFAQTYYVERITVYEHPHYQAFVAREGGALQSGGPTLEDTLLADSVAMAMARDSRLKGATVTVSANKGRVSISGHADHQQNYIAQQIAKRVAGPGSSSGELSSDLG
jgi:osmotically-inducible protein OsmY